MPKITEATRAERRSAILSATLQSLTTHGYAGTNMRTIAAAAGMTKGGLYAYFDSKEAILLELARQQMEHQLSAGSPLPHEAAVDQLMRVFHTGVLSSEKREDRLIGRAIMDMWANARNLPNVHDALLGRYQRYRTVIADVIRRGQTGGEIDPALDPEETAALMLALRDGIVYHSISLQLPVDRAVLDRRLLAILAGHLTQHLSEHK